MKKRPAGVTALVAFYFLNGVMGLWLTVSGLTTFEDDTIIWGIGGTLYVLFSLLLGWGLWGLSNWARLLSMAFNILAALGQASLGFLFFFGSGLAKSLDTLTSSSTVSDLSPTIGLSLFVGAAICALIIWYLTRQTVRHAFHKLGSHETLIATSSQGQMPLPFQSTQEHAPPPASAKTVAHYEAWLVARTGPKVGQQFPLNHERNTIGRDTERASIQVDDPQVSRQHAQFSFERGHILLYDLASTNGTFVNNRRVQKQVLNDGDVVRVGQTEFIFKQAEDQDAGAIKV